MKRILDSPALAIAVFAFLLNLPWEFLQMQLYADTPTMSHRAGIDICVLATVGDAVIMLGAYVVVALASKSWIWIRVPRPPQVIGFVLIGLVASVVIEAMATRADGVIQWRYAATMPMIPVLGVGLAPILQWLILPPLVLWFAGRHLGRR